jgi:hypothetical protein
VTGHGNRSLRQSFPQKQESRTDTRTLTHLVPPGGQNRVGALRLVASPGLRPGEERRI